MNGWVDLFVCFHLRARWLCEVCVRVTFPAVTFTVQHRAYYKQRLLHAAQNALYR